MNNDVKIFGGIIGATIILIIAAAFFLTKGTSPEKASSESKPLIIKQSELVKSDSWSLGTPSARVTIVEFGDFQCPSCKQEEAVVKEVLKKYGDNVRLVYRHFPLSQIHQYALHSADAAEAAGMQGKFWEYHDKLYEISPDLTTENLIKAAEDTGLDMDKFRKDLDSDTARQKVLNDLADANKFGLTGTPTFFINGKLLRLATLPTLSDFQKEIDKLLK